MSTGSDLLGQLSFLNQWKGENGRRNYFMTNLQEKMLPDVRMEYRKWGSMDFFYQDDSTHFEPSQLLSGAKTGDLREKPLDRPQADLGLSHMWPELYFYKIQIYKQYHMFWARPGPYRVIPEIIIPKVYRRLKSPRIQDFLRSDN